jgi:hypothetical protein
MICQKYMAIIKPLECKRDKSGLKTLKMGKYGLKIKEKPG